MSGTLCNRRRSSGKSSGCSVTTFNALIADMKGNIYLGGVHELVEITELQEDIIEYNVTISKNDPFASKRASAAVTFGKAKKLRTESSNLIGLKDGSLSSYTGLPEVNYVIKTLGDFTEQLYDGMVDLCDSQIVDTDKVAQMKNRRGHDQDQIGNRRWAWDACEPLVRSSFVAEVRDLDLYNCQNTEYLEAHGSKAKRATVCLYAIGILFVLASYGNNFVPKGEVTSLMNVGRDGPAFKDAINFLNHSGVLVLERSKFQMTKSWFDKVDFRFKFNHSTPECKQDPNFCAWMGRLNQAILRNPNRGGSFDNSNTDNDD